MPSLVVTRDLKAVVSSNFHIVTWLASIDEARLLIQPRGASGRSVGGCYEAMQEYGVMLTGFDTLQPADAAIVAAAHKERVDAGWRAIQYLLIEGQGLVFDVKMKLDRSTLPPCVELWWL